MLSNFTSDGWRVINIEKSNKHKHYDLIVKYYADPEKYIVEAKSPITGNWSEISEPTWTFGEYRLIGKPKPKVTKYKVLLKACDDLAVSCAYYEDEEDFKNQNLIGNVEFISLIKESAREFDA